jgi:hypothetical protein
MESKNSLAPSEESATDPYPEQDNLIILMKESPLMHILRKKKGYMLRLS